LRKTIGHMCCAKEANSLSWKVHFSNEFVYSCMCLYGCMRACLCRNAASRYMCSSMPVGASTFSYIYVCVFVCVYAFILICVHRPQQQARRRFRTTAPSSGEACPVLAQNRSRGCVLKQIPSPACLLTANLRRLPCIISFVCCLACFL
jgi:hypothetical protein